MTTILSIAAVLAAGLLLYGIYLVQKERLRCWDCGGIYLRRVSVAGDGNEDVWVCRQCGAVTPDSGGAVTNQAGAPIRVDPTDIEAE